MSHSKKKKNQEFYISVKETADKLRILADELEKGIISIDEKEVSIALDTLIKVNLKSKGEKLSLKMKSKSLSSLGDKKKVPLVKEEPNFKPQNLKDGYTEVKPIIGNKVENYKELKKRMSQDFKAIIKSCMKERSIPESLLVERFYQDSIDMCNYQDKGEEFYKTYLKQVKIFFQAFKASDLKAIGSSVTSLNQIKKKCHGKYN